MKVSANGSESSVVLEYVWLTADHSLCSKCKVIYCAEDEAVQPPVWNYDGSSTGQADKHHSEISLIPCATFTDPFRGFPNLLVLCKGVTEDDEDVIGYNRTAAETVFNRCADEKFWFGLEQEYTLLEPATGTPLGWPSNPNHFPPPQGRNYCGVGTERVVGREIVEEHAACCLDAGVRLCGLNAEVMLGQWEYQVGPCDGLTAGDHLWISRYILQRVAEKHGVMVSLDPKPVPGEWNGAGCHANFSTLKMRENGAWIDFKDALEKLENAHEEHIAVYGDGNERRLTGRCETASIDKFSYGVGDRGASIRIPAAVARMGYRSGYLEDRRPASNCDPYLVTAAIANTICPVNQ